MTEPEIEPDEARALARSLRKVLDEAARVLTEDGDRPLVRLITEHIGRPIGEIPNVVERWAGWELVNLQRGVDAYLAEHSPNADWHGVAGTSMRGHHDFMDMLNMANSHGSFDVGAVDYTSVATGPDSSMEAVQFGFVRCTAPDGSPVVVCVRGPAEHMMPTCTLQVLATNRDTATAVRERIGRLMREHDAFRGQILTFGFSEFRGNDLVTFQPRPRLEPDEVVLPPGVLQAIEQHVILAGSRADKLRAAGQHLKRGLLLHGPPGTGKTHTVRYLLGRMIGSTVVIMSGPALLKFLSAATALARRLQPSIVVVEDVDLIAEDRSYSSDGNPLLFQLLNEMEGIGADADITFVLTTNRVDVLEHALTDRPGRVDFAMEIPRPDADGRERLLRLYTRDVILDVTDVEPLIAATEGSTASFIRELARRAVLHAIDHGADGEIRLDESTLRAALDDLLDERNALTRSILGGNEPGPPLGPLPYRTQPIPHGMQHN